MNEEGLSHKERIQLEFFNLLSKGYSSRSARRHLKKKYKFNFCELYSI